MVDNKLLDYPILQKALNDNPEAKAQFNALLVGMRSEEVGNKLRGQIARLEMELAGEAKANKRLSELLKTVVEFVSSVGGIIESQVDLSPYKQETEERKVHEVKFDPAQVRKVLGYYWSLTAASMEARLAGSQEVDWENVLSRPYNLPPPKRRRVR